MKQNTKDFPFQASLLQFPHISLLHLTYR